MSAEKIPAEITAEALECVRDLMADPRKPMAPIIARALMARDTAARKECAEIARRIDNECGMEAGLAAACAEAIEATIGGEDGR